MIGKLLELFTGKDDVERIANSGDITRLMSHLQTRRLYFPTLPSNSLAGEEMTEENILDMAEKGARELSDNDFELWITEIDGDYRLPAFSSMKKAGDYVSRIANESDVAISVGVVEMFLEDVIKSCDVDCIDLNQFSDSWQEIRVEES